MATNKRKESAALFELIGKSTLKVPKNSGSLKIPAWWSNKSNAPAEPSTPTIQRSSSNSIPVTRGNGHSAPASTSPTPQSRPVIRATPAPVQPLPPQAEPIEDNPTQSRLFEPPRGNAMPAVSPSIRPPPPPGAAARSQPAVTPAAAPEDLPLKSTEPIAEEELEAEPVSPRVFAPNTHAQADFERAGARAAPRVVAATGGEFARLPAWVFIAGISAIVLILGIIVFVIQHNKGKATPPESLGPPSNLPSTTTPGIPEMRGGGGSGRSLVPTPPGNGGASGRGQVAATGRGQVVTPGVGHVYDIGTVQRKPSMLYIVILSTPSRDVAQNDAKYIADRGVDVSIETDYSSTGKLLYVLVSVDGFPTVVAAEQLRAKIVDIGRSLAREQRLTDKDPFRTAGAKQVVRAAPATSAKG